MPHGFGPLQTFPPRVTIHAGQRLANLALVRKTCLLQPSSQTNGSKCIHAERARPNLSLHAQSQQGNKPESISSAAVSTGGRALTLKALAPHAGTPPDTTETTTIKSRCHVGADRWGGHCAAHLASDAHARRLPSTCNQVALVGGTVWGNCRPVWRRVPICQYADELIWPPRGTVERAWARATANVVSLTPYQGFSLLGRGCLLLCRNKL